ncbi:complement factor H isoform 2-T2 [Aulostomus maculatus]
MIRLLLLPAMEVLRGTSGRRGLRSLLLLYLFVLKPAAGCPRPEGRGNTVLTTESLLLNTFAEGSFITLQCGKGFETESGSGVSRCINGNWTEPTITCKKKDCGRPPVQPHMVFNMSGGTLFGAIISVTCDKGYQVQGSSFMRCYDPGWIGKGRCEIVTCSTPPVVTHGKSSWDSQDEPEYGEIIHYLCNEGYTISGNNSIVCTESGQYNSLPPVCNVVATEETISTKMVTPTPTKQETSTTTDSPVTPTAHRDKTMTESAAPTTATQGDRGVSAAEDKATTPRMLSTTLSSFQDKHDVTRNTDKGTEYVPIVIAVVSVFTVAGVTTLLILRFFQKRKGSPTETTLI